MSSTSNAQNLLVNVFRPTYVYEAGVGYTPSLVVSNVDKIVSATVVASNLVINDAGSNTYIGSDAGNPATTLRASSNNVAIGYNAGNGFSNTSNTIAIGYNALGGSLSNVSNTVAIGANTIGGGVNNIFIGHDTGTIGSNNILIGPNQTPGIVSNQLRIGSNNTIVLAADLSSQYVGINNANPIVSFDVSGQAYFRNKVGIQVEAPSKSLEVNGQTYSSIGFLAGRGSVGNPAYTFYADESTGLYSPGNGHGSLVANGQRYITFGGSVVDFHNQVLVNADISGSGIGNLITVSNGHYRDISGPAILSDISEGNMYAIGDIFTNNLIYSGSISNTNTNTSNVIGGVVLSNGDVSANTYNGPGGTANAPHYTFSDDRTTGVFFPGTGSIGLTAGGVERMRISNSFVGIGTTAPGSALDVSGIVQVRGAGGIVTINNGVINAGVGINVSGTPIVASNGAFSNASSTSNRIGGVTLNTSNITTGSGLNTVGGVDLWNSNVTCQRISATDTAGSNQIGGVTLSNQNIEFSGTITGGAFFLSNQIGGVTLCNSNVSGVTTTTSANLLASGYIRNALVPTQFDISGGNIQFVGALTGSTVSTSNVIGGVTLSNSDLSMSGAGRIRGVNTTSNLIGGVTLSNFDLSMGGAGRILGQTTASNLIGGVTLSNFDLSMGGTGRILGQTSVNNVMGGVTLGNSNVSGVTTTTSTNLLASGYIRNALIPTQFDISGGNMNVTSNLRTGTINVANAGSSTSASFYFFNQTNLGFYGANANEVAFVSSNGERLRFNNFGIFNDGTSSNTVGGVILTNTRVGIGINPTFSLHLNADSAAKPTTNTWSVSSDERIKQNIVLADTSLCYSIVKTLKLKRFTWDVSYMPNVPDRNSVGWIAQDVSSVFPNAVQREKTKIFDASANLRLDDFHVLDVDQIYKTMYGALSKVIEDKEALEARVLTLEEQLSNVLTRLSNANL